MGREGEKKKAITRGKTKAQQWQLLSQTLTTEDSSQNMNVASKMTF